MHTLLMILGGLFLLTVIYGVTFWRGISLHRAFPVFAVLWGVATAINLWVGVTQVGYSVAEELAILAIIFGLPCIIAWLLARRTA